MKHMFYGAEPPWGSKVKWQIVNGDLEYLIHRHHDALDKAMKLARDLETRLASIYPLLNDLCRATCPWCPDPCCLTADVWIDFKDLLFLHLAGHSIPVKQLRSNSSNVCRCWGPKGCALPRMTRPWICTWYLCPTQQTILRRKSHHIRDKFSRLIRAVKVFREELENEFIRVVS